MPSLPNLSLEKIFSVLPSAVSFTLLGSIDSLLSAVVADGMTGRRHRSTGMLRSGWVEAPLVGDDVADSIAPRGLYNEAHSTNPEIVVYRITGALFFGAAASIGSVLEQIADTHKSLIIDLSMVPFLDSSGANLLEGIARKTQPKGIQLWITGPDQTCAACF